MFGTKGRLTAMVLIVGFLLTGVLAYDVFQMPEATAHDLHDNDSDAVGSLQTSVRVGTESATEACPICGYQAYVTWGIYERRAYSGWVTTHYNWPDPSTPCHEHWWLLGVMYTYVSLVNVDCSNYSCGG